jgi:hypothetical protein
VHEPGALAKPLKGGPSPIFIIPPGVRHKPSDGLAMPRDNDFLSLFHPVKQASERILCFEGSNLRRLRS